MIVLIAEFPQSKAENLQIAIYMKGRREKPEIVIPTTMQSGQPATLVVENKSGDKIKTIHLHDLSTCLNEDLKLQVRRRVHAFSFSLSFFRSLSFSSGSFGVCLCVSVCSVVHCGNTFFLWLLLFFLLSHQLLDSVGMEADVQNPIRVSLKFLYGKVSVGTTIVVTDHDNPSSILDLSAAISRAASKVCLFLCS